ncbi:hypothetical protein PPYR_06093 [Photinus pyralis]|uniref:SCP domain-containing protein n=1 Tax=Photinus pyralis TaxID=7054 RepID=A0A1Y1KFF2_PHOPY|nr:Golgi-associated plant pathogenesis-related protein 1-like [Photinus pyralis]XP_031338208.1 Golgi-associated plant pathogenesis-related protein 1-like [Photinus pyralis]KAB0800353.1 hypothetical protein PPYR_06093 [Photinus pyralis]
MRVGVELLCFIGASVLAVLGNDQINTAVLTLHNQYRAKHGVPALVLDSEMNRYAQEWANQLAKTSTFSHRPNNKYGENLYWGSYPGETDLQISQRGVKAWYDENKFYNYDSETVQTKALHFTQVIWRSSRRLGIGVARGNNGVYLVCNYDPRGNFVGQFRANVPRPTG